MEMQIKKTLSCCFCLIQWKCPGLIQEITAHAGEDVRKGECLFMQLEEPAGSDTMEISVEFPKKSESRYSTRPNYITLGFYPNDTISYYWYSCLSIFIAALCAIAKNREHPQHQ